ncbi:MAG: hypothetical protein CMG13_07515 [Candidatus Marinimicrobia bacterium]|nr:hypothetical protein [Candidatus Neomarinimicrobiota bacterium]|tara:strand:+ start:739 stop:1398 length:660 start_codon:yes stop_codon:yes gene_type:complete
MTDIKICGIRDYDSALVAKQHGASYLGFVFHEASPRYIEPTEVSKIIKSLKHCSTGSSKYVGLFVDKSVKEVISIGHECDLDIIQLSGSEPPEFCDMIPFPVFKVIHVKPSDLLKDIEQAMDIYLNHVTEVILDNGGTSLQGGTGQAFNWNIAKQLSEKGHNFILAGGINITNIAQAIKDVNPMCLDISSGVETEGVKDHNKIMELLNLTKSVQKQYED